MKKVVQYFMFALAFVAFSAQADEDKTAFEAAVVEKANEWNVSYKPIFQGKKKYESVIEHKHFYVKINLVNAVNLGNRFQYKLLEITVTDVKKRVIAYQRQYSDSFKNMNNVVMNFLHPDTKKLYVVGVRKAWLKK